MSNLRTYYQPSENDVASDLYCDLIDAVKFTHSRCSNQVLSLHSPPSQFFRKGIILMYLK